MTYQTKDLGILFLMPLHFPNSKLGRKIYANISEAPSGKAVWIPTWREIIP